jgi:outer membrane protein assembly factor BamB
MAMCGNCGAQNPATAERCGGCAAELTVAALHPSAQQRPIMRRDAIVTAADGKLFALRVRDGMLVWWNQLGRLEEQIFEVQIHEDRVFALTSGGLLFCIEYASGRTRWTHPTQPGSEGALMVVAGLIFVAYGDTLDCLNTHGYRLWTQRVAGIGRRPITLAIPAPQQ